MVKAFPASGNGSQTFPEPSGTDALASVDETEALPGMSPGRPRIADPWSDVHGAQGVHGAPDPHDAHDPHEVTVQLDAVALRADNRLVGQAGETRENSDGPVFVDESGRRSRRYRRIGILVGLACAVYAVVIVMTLLSGNSNAPWLPVPGQGEGEEAGRVDNSPLPAETVAPTDAGSPSPGTSPVPSDAGTPSSSATAPGASASAQDPGAVTDPKPTATKTTIPGPGGDPTPDPTPTDPVTSNPPDPTPTEEPSPDPTETPVGDSAGTGTDTVAGGAPNPAPVAATTPPPESTL